MIGVKGAMTTAMLKTGRVDPALKNVGMLVRGAPLTPPEIAVKVAWYGCCCCVVEQVFKKCCFIFTLKECVENTTKLLHEGWLLAYALKKGHVTNEVLGNRTDTWRVR